MSYRPSFYGETVRIERRSDGFYIVRGDDERGAFATREQAERYAHQIGWR